MRISDWSSDGCSSDLRHASPKPGFVKIPLTLRDPHGLAALACIVTYTPGTVWAGLSEHDDALTLHVLDLTDEAHWIRLIVQRYERPLKEILTRKIAGEGKRGSVSVDPGGSRNI